jgi:hypothetical protein
MESLEVYQIHLLLLELENTVLTWQEGGKIVNIGREEAIDLWQTARTWSKPSEKDKVIEYAMKGLVALFSHMQLATFLEFYLDVITGLLHVDYPGPLKMLKMLAKLKRWTQLLERLEFIEKIKDKAEKIQKFNELKEELKSTGSELLEVSMADTEPSSFVMRGVGSLVAMTRGFLVAPILWLRGCSPIVLISSVVGILGILVLIIYLLFGGLRAPIGTVPSDAELVEDAGEVIAEVPVDEVQATQTPTTAPVTNPLLAFVLKYGDFSPEERDQIVLASMLDPEDDFIYSKAMEIILKKFGWLDITTFSVLWLRMTSGGTDLWFNHSHFPCDSEIEGGIVVCTETTGPMPAGNVIMAVMQLGEEIPLDDADRFYTYAAVFDADGDTANNFQYQPPYDWDYFQNTDRWYTLDWDPTQADWFLTVTDVANNQWNAPSNARAVIYHDMVIFFIPAEEFSVEQPGYRLSAFGHDGTFAVAESCGDVTGADPTEALRMPYDQEILIGE